MKSPHCFVSLLLCASLLLSAFSGTALATESASVFEFEYAFEDYWYDDEDVYKRQAFISAGMEA